MPSIDRFQFGRMVIGHKTFTSDLIIFPDGKIQDSWWRTRGHFLELNDIISIVNTGPDIIIIGTGAAGRMKVDPTLFDRIKDMTANPAVQLTCKPTDQAVKEYHTAVRAGKKTSAGFHLTC